MTQLLEVTPADRETYLIVSGVTGKEPGDTWVMAMVRKGKDDHQPQLQAIVRNRLDGEATAARRYRDALERINAAVVDGKVCDDVAWFSPAETLHDFIQSVLHPGHQAAIADLFPTGSGVVHRADCLSFFAASPGPCDCTAEASAMGRPGA
ncbi:hypothetical protein EGM87_13760 [Sphingobium sp. RSMS]|uniref:hypothetical protein n=1 Tax=Sphingobium sp. RSMS TaxID=520734 RepID=UPI0010F74F5E|nr:hypothetical protein [Sphingobium sp. RSMS]UXC90108.1 hypothetical protein EGM87_13760 [Sphingobium sp. RSMS]